MSFLKKTFPSVYFVSMFVFLSLGIFLFAFQQTTFAAQTKVVCEGLSLGSSCKPAGGCDDSGTNPTENDMGYCSDVGTGTSHACCVKIPILIANQTACEAISGASCPPAGTTDANCLRAPFSPANQADLLGYCDGATGQRSCCKLKPTATVPGTDDYCVNTLHGVCKIGPTSCAPITPLGDCTTLASVARKCCSVPAGGACVLQGGSCQSACPTGTGPITASDCGTDKCCKSTTPGVPGASASILFTNPIGDPASPDGVNNSTVEGVVGSISGVLQSIIVVLALVFIVIGAVIYVTSAGNDERMKTAKGAITASMIGLALAIAAPSFLKEIYSVLGGNLCGGITDPAQLATCNQSIASITASSTQSLAQLSLKVLQFLLSIVGILGIIMLVIGGLAYLTSAGDEERSQSGKKIITYAIIGIAVVLASLILVTQVAKLFV